MSGSIAKDSYWKPKEQSEEARYAREKEQAQLTEIRDKIGIEEKPPAETQRDPPKACQLPSGDIEGGYGGQEDLEDRYATTSGEH